MKEIIAMHGWCGESSDWAKWQKYFNKNGWIWHSHERGYGEIDPKEANWSNNKVTGCLNKQILICHSLGLHLIKKEILEKATHIILLSSFSRFIPTSENNRSIIFALERMKRALGSLEEKTMIRKFLQKSCKPYPLTMSPSRLLMQGLSLPGRNKLNDDLELLIRTDGLPKGFPRQSFVLVIHGEKDAILLPGTKKQLITDLTKFLQTKPIHLHISGDGHSLLKPEAMQRVKQWIDAYS
tara:strand:+ start:8357 stop:9073 length:717 start_codon:yes stop_codon:yes gene_type:complete